MSSQAPNPCWSMKTEKQQIKFPGQFPKWVLPCKVWPRMFQESLLVYWTTWVTFLKSVWNTDKGILWKNSETVLSLENTEFVKVFFLLQFDQYLLLVKPGYNFHNDFSSPFLNYHYKYSWIQIHVLCMYHMNSTVFTVELRFLFACRSN